MRTPPTHTPHPSPTHPPARTHTHRSDKLSVARCCLASHRGGTRWIVERACPRAARQRATRPPICQPASLPPQPHAHANSIGPEHCLPCRYNLSLGIGLADVKGKVFRIGHLGNMDELMLSSALCGAEMALMDAGVPVTPGSGVSRAIQYWQETARVIPTREGLLAQQ